MHLKDQDRKRIQQEALKIPKNCEECKAKYENIEEIHE